MRPSLTRRQPSQADEHTFIAIRVTSYSASVSAGINPSLYGNKPREIRREDLVLESSISLEVRGVCTYPAPRTNLPFEITIHPEKPKNIGQRAKDIHKKDENNVLQYRKHRGELYPVYDLPSGLGLIERRRSDAVWSGWVFVEPNVVANMLVLLGQAQQLYLSIHERKIGRNRWIWNLTLQTTDPAAE